MYKSKLQELCQRKQWSMPKYTSMKYGPDHNPRFGASVSVNGTSFDSLLVSKSNKEAHNHAAMLAFLHFTSPHSDSESAAIAPKGEEIDQNLHIHSHITGVRNDSSTLSETDKGGPNAEETYQSLKTQSDAVGVVDDIHCQYKNQLQKYAQLRKLDMPTYSSGCNQGTRGSHFKATVTVGEQIFESSESFKTSKEAESCAAKAALMSLLVECFQEDESHIYKNLLQELAQREDLGIPVYKTINRGEPHKPIFFSTVELEGEIFHGKAAKSKKQAELDAARVAYVALKERGSTRIAELTSPYLKGQAPKSTASLGLVCDSLQNLKHECVLAPYPAQKYVETKEKNYSAETSLNTVESSSSSFPAISPQLGKMNTSEKVSSCSESSSISTSEDLVSFSDTKLNPPSLSISDSNVRSDTTGLLKSYYLLCNKVRVYGQYPNCAFPKGITVLPISDDKWVPISLEFPNEEKIN